MDQACWDLLDSIEQSWNVDIQNESFWQIDYLQELREILNNFADLVGGDDIWKNVLADSAQKGGKDKFIIGGLVHSPICYTGCSNLGIVSFQLDNTFQIGRGTVGSSVVNSISDPAAARVSIAHEFSHILYGILPDNAYSDYLEIRGWKVGPSNPGTLNNDMWFASNGADPIYLWPENPSHHLVQATALKVAGNNTWDLVAVQDKMVKGPIPATERIFVDNIGSYLP